MWGQVILALVFAVVCGGLSYATARQVVEWNRLFGRTEWDQTIAGGILSFICGVAALGMFGFALVCAFQAGYQR